MKVKENPASTEDILFKIRSEKPVSSFVEFVMDNRFDWKRNYIPQPFPPKSNNGNKPSCGIAAFWSAAISGQPTKPIPPIFKSDYFPRDLDTKQISLRQICKEEKITEFGPIYQANHFDKLAKRIGITGKELHFNPQPEQYIETICHLIDEGNRIIIASDITPVLHFPSTRQNYSTHWALIFGYYFIDKECFFLVTQFNHDYCWNGKNLWLSNFNLPRKNPAFGKYYKDKAEKSYNMIDADSKIPAGSKIYEVKDQYLDNFRFCGYAIPSQHRRLVFQDVPQFVEEIKESYLNFVGNFLNTFPISTQKKLLYPMIRITYQLGKDPHKIQLYQNYLEALRLCLDFWIKNKALGFLKDIITQTYRPLILKILTELIFYYTRPGENAGVLRMIETELSRSRPDFSRLNNNIYSFLAGSTQHLEAADLKSTTDSQNQFSKRQS